MMASLALVVKASSGGVLWQSSNCNMNGGPGVVQGTVTDAVCCNQDQSPVKCSDNTDMTSCNLHDTCHWKENSEGAFHCDLNRDSENNVCCQSTDTKRISNCGSIMAGNCPPDWEVATACCPEPYDKYAGILSTSHHTKICCNAPCQAIEKAYQGGYIDEFNQTVEGIPSCNAQALNATNCGPGQRSYMSSLMAMSGSGLGGYGGLGDMLGMGMMGGGSGGYGSGVDPILLSSLMGMPVIMFLLLL